MGPAASPSATRSIIGRAARGPYLDTWSPPAWLLEHQLDAARRAAAALEIFGAVLLADAVGLGKTYVALALATRYRRPVAVVPAALAPQWRRAAVGVGVDVPVVSHEALSRGRPTPDADLIIVDEAHRLRNPQTRRYDRLARDVRRAHGLLLSATPVVNRAADLAHLLRLFLPDHALAALGIGSIEEAVRGRDQRLLRRAASALTVARTARVLRDRVPRLPRPVDARLRRPPPTEPSLLVQLVSLIDGLTFPGVANREAARLLRVHALFRLASSDAALRETLQRHLHYLERAKAAAARGERLSRPAMRALFGATDEFQLELGGLTDDAAVPGASELDAERRRLAALLDLVNRGRRPAPKIVCLQRLLRQRRQRKTVVFTAALATALQVARALDWQEVAVVGAGRAWIASGPLSTDAALALFAPLARGAPLAARAARASVLIATDLVSEGLDLQDADAVVHYDLPWTPLRLTQRLGRIVRLGSRHRDARVWWFAPPDVLERQLHLEDRLRGKGGTQLALGVASTSVPGAAQVWNADLEARELLATHGAAAAPHSTPTHAVVRAPAVAVFAIRWLTDGGAVPEVIAISGTPPRELLDWGTLRTAVERLAAAPPSARPIPLALVHAFRDLVRRRLAGVDRGPVDPATGRLARRILARARRAAHRRACDEISTLDGVLDRLAGGLRAGAARELDAALRHRRATPQLARWLKVYNRMPKLYTGVRLDGALFGDGSVV